MTIKNLVTTLVVALSVTFSSVSFAHKPTWNIYGVGNGNGTYVLRSNSSNAPNVIILNTGRYGNSNVVVIRNSPSRFRRNVGCINRIGNFGVLSTNFGLITAYRTMVQVAPLSGTNVVIPFNFNCF